MSVEFGVTMDRQKGDSSRCVWARGQSETITFDQETGTRVMRSNNARKIMTGNMLPSRLGRRPSCHGEYNSCRTRVPTANGWTEKMLEATWGPPDSTSALDFAQRSREARSKYFIKAVK